jgi:hypothetical protein
VGELINLNRYRKQRHRTEAARHAAENWVRSGRDKAELARIQAEQGRRSHDLDGKRLDDARPEEAE